MLFTLLLLLLLLIFRLLFLYLLSLSSSHLFVSNFVEFLVVVLPLIHTYIHTYVTVYVASCIVSCCRCYYYCNVLMLFACKYDSWKLFAFLLHAINITDMKISSLDSDRNLHSVDKLACWGLALFPERRDVEIENCNEAVQYVKWQKVVRSENSLVVSERCLLVNT